MSSSRPASVTILWHMHQPWYGDPRTGQMRLPWVRLHALKDYLDMIAVSEEHPECPVSINLVPSLLLQIQHYADQQTTDQARIVCGQAPTDLAAEDRRWLLDNAFKCNWDRMVDASPRFKALLDKRGRRPSSDGWQAAAAAFTEADFRDLQVWLHLAWCGHDLRRHDPVVAALVKQDKGFTEDQKQALLTSLDAAVGTVIPRYRRAAEAGLVELSTTPFYHPILPLLCHWPDARVAMPTCALPVGLEDMPEDAEAQLRRGRELFASLLGHEPAGLWPSEGSVSTVALELAHRVGFRWAATDEQILAQSILRGSGGRPLEAAEFLQCHEHSGLALFFRHHRASDRIGFDYGSWPTEAAVQDMLRLLDRTAANDGGLERPVVPVILDGENCWEYYRHNGHDFLAALYRHLAEHPRLQPVTFSQHLEQAPAPKRLDWLFPGSWINHDFYIWAGHREDQRAWQLLYLTRRALKAAEDGLDEAVRRQAWEHIYIAEGSDWYWWYGDDHSSDDDAAFDELFRDHLARVYELIGQDVPDALTEPVAGLLPPSPVTSPVAPFTPAIDGIETDFFEWRAAGRIESRGPAGAMTRGDRGEVIQRIRFGFGEVCLYLCLQVDSTVTAAGGYGVELSWSAEGRQARLVIDDLRRCDRRDVPLAEPPKVAAQVAVGTVVEVAVPLLALPASVGGRTELALTVRQAGEVVERWPDRGAYEFPIPDEGDWLSQWLV